ncbi:hypothetical protein LINPERHAP1_LOCUS920 [Linum perenne]
MRLGARIFDRSDYIFLGEKGIQESDSMRPP